MRLAICTLSAALLSGCSWLGYGGQSGGHYGGGSYDAACQNGYAAQYSSGYAGGASGCSGVGGGYGQGAGGLAGYGQGGGYGLGSGYGAGGAGYGMGGAGGYGAGGATGYGAGAGYGTGGGVGGYGAGGAAGYGASGYGLGGAGGYGTSAYGQGGSAGYGAGAGGFGVGSSVIGANGQVIGTVGQGGTVTGAGGQVIGYVGQGGTVTGAGGQVIGTVAGGGATMIGSGAQFGSAVGGGFTQYAGGGVTQVQGAPIYVPRPYPAYYQTPRLRLQGGSNPVGFAGYAGLSNFTSGEVFAGEAAKPAGVGGRSVSALDAIEYADAFDAGKLYGGAVEYDVSRNTTLFAGANYAQYEGQTIENGTITQDNSASGGAIETGAGFYEFSDMNELTVEGGVRQYVGGGRGLRPYVGASAGFTHNNDVKLTASSDNSAVIATPEEQLFIREGWHPTASGIIGAEMAAGPNLALGVETGLRWTDDRSTNLESDDSWSVPVTLRGRVAF